MSTDSDMNDWFLERDVKDAAVILNDKLISDALLNGTLPIKSEHSYSLNSDGDSLPDSPHSLQAKMDGKFAAINKCFQTIFQASDKESKGRQIKRTISSTFHASFGWHNGLSVVTDFPRTMVLSFIYKKKKYSKYPIGIVWNNTGNRNC